MSMAKVGARFVVKALPSLRVVLRRRAEAMTARGTFTPEECRDSLYRSLQQLRTERIDFFLMHEVQYEQITGELIQTLEEAMQRGCIGKFGIATSAAAAAMIARTMSCGTAVQFPSSVLAPAVGLVPDNFEKITHSALGDAFTSLHTHLRADKALQKKWSTALDIDCSDIEQLGRLFLYAALTENAGGTVVFSSLDEGRIQRNAALIRGSAFSGSQVDLLRNLVESQQWPGHTHPKTI
jgi:Aldo/keto reductase family